MHLRQTQPTLTLVYERVSTRADSHSVACVTFLPAVAYAQASLAGTARDTSGAVLPGVPVEAASSVLIEKVRTAVTDRQLSERAS